MNYGDIIEYIDDTFDENFEDAKHWCQDNNAHLIELIERRAYKEVEEEVVDEDGNVKIVKVQKLFRYFEITKNPEPTPMDKATEVKMLRDAYINGIEWRISRYRSQKELGRETDDSEETYISILEYMQYLRDIPEQSGFPNIEVLTFEEWSAE